MDRDAFLVGRRQRWVRLEDLLIESRGGLRRISGSQLLELGRLYRDVTSDLAIAERDFPQDTVTTYLRGLVGRTHPLIYQDRPASLAVIGRFVRYGFPEAFRGAIPYFLLAFGLFAGSAVVAAALVTWRQSIADVLLPGTAQNLRGVMEHHHLWMKSATENHSVAANFIMLNNIQVAFLAFAGGILCGTLTIYAMVMNGINLGAIAAMVSYYGLSRPFWAFVVPHGVIELSVIWMAGAAGLIVADGILRPELQRRTDSIAAAGKRAGLLLLGCIPLLVVAGTIEGFFSPSNAPDWSKLLVAVCLGALLYWYLLGSRPAVRVQRYGLEDLLASKEPSARTIAPPMDTSGSEEEPAPTGGPAL